MLEVIGFLIRAVLVLCHLIAEMISSLGDTPGLGLW
jgi:hypothetical protein